MSAAREIKDRALAHAGTLHANIIRALIRGAPEVLRLDHLDDAKRAPQRRSGVAGAASRVTPGPYGRLTNPREAVDNGNEFGTFVRSPLQPYRAPTT